MPEPQNPLELGDELLIFNVGFGPDGIEVDFLDPRRQAKGLTEVTKLGIDRGMDLIDQLEELVRDIVDEALRERRQ